MDRASDGRWCRVEGAEKLPAELGGAQAVCSVLEGSLGKLAPKTVALTVRSPFLINAEVTAVDGRRLPTVTVGRSDRPLSGRAIRMLAEAIAAQLTAGQANQERE
jgi:hypothetical protein